MINLVFCLTATFCVIKSISWSYACVEKIRFIRAGNNPMVGMTVAVAVAIEEASK